MTSAELLTSEQEADTAALLGTRYTTLKLKANFPLTVVDDRYVVAYSVILGSLVRLHAVVDLQEGQEIKSLPPSVYAFLLSEVRTFGGHSVRDDDSLIPA